MPYPRRAPLWGAIANALAPGVERRWLRRRPVDPRRDLAAARYQN